MVTLARRWLLLLVGVLLFGAAVEAQEDALVLPVSIAVADAPLREVVAELARQTGAVIEVQPSVAESRVSLSLQAAPLRTALEMIAQATGASVGLSGLGFLVRSSLESVPAGFRPLATVRPKLTRQTARKLVYRCQNLLPSEIAGIFGRPAVHRPGPDGGLEPAVTPGYQFGQTVIDAALPSLAEAARERLQQRWQAIATNTSEHAGCRGGMALPNGISVLIGYDPHRTVIVVGTPAAIPGMDRLLRELDRSSQNLRLSAVFADVPAATLDDFGVRWVDVPSDYGSAQLRYAVGSVANLTSALRTHGGTLVNAEPLGVRSAQPAIISLSRGFMPQSRDIEGCATTPAIAADVEAGLITTDLKAIVWPSDGGATAPLRLNIEPAYGDVLLSRRSGEASVARTTAVPCSSTTVAVASGQAVLLVGVVPPSGVRAADACAVFTELPLVGDYYRLPGTSAPERVTLVLLVPAPAD